MRTKFKKVISTCLAIILLLSTAAIAPITAFAGETQAVSTGAISGDFEYDIYDYSENTIAITGYKGDATEVTIPSEIDGKKVTNISWRAFKSCTSITSVTIPDSVTKIDYDAFSGCTSLTSITILGGVTYIDGYAFSGCTSLESVTIPDSVTYIGRYAFKDCTSLKSVTIPASVEHIGEYVFGEDSGIFIKITGYNGTAAESYANKYGHEFISLGEVQTTEPIKYTILDDGTAIITKYTGSATEVTIPSEIDGKKVTSIGENAFYDCRSLKSITIPDSVTSIGFCAFYNCTSLTSITIPDSVTSIGDWAFSDCTSLKSITIPDSVTSIGRYAFSDITSLTDVIIPDSVTSIGDYAFSDCTSLESVTIPDSVTSIGDGIFSSCKSLTNIYVDSKNLNYIAIDGVLFDKEVKTIICYPAGKEPSSYSIPESVTSIGESAFTYCTSLTDVTIPDSVTVIDYDAFARCTSLESITIPDSVTEIGGRAFRDCTSLTDVTIPDSVTSIGLGAFQSTAWYDNQPDGVVYAGKVLYQYKGRMTQKTSITLKDGTKGIGDYAFLGLTNLTSITIPDSVTSIGDYAFGYYYNYYDGDYIKIDGFRITGCKGSAAERYANDNGFEFIGLGEAPTKDPEVLGDVNADGKVNIKDATTIQKSAASLVTLTEKQNKAADVNGDGKVNVNDATAIQKYTAGIDTGFKIGNRLL